jgi:twitching motility protein PilT
MRDLETIALAVTAAETGHLVLATLHTTSASSTIDRIIDVFPSGQQQQIKMQLSTTLEGVVCQTLIHKKDTKGRVCAMEIMVGVTGIRNLIREGKTFLIGSMIQSGQKEGMQSLNMSLKKLVQDKIISLEDAIQKSSDPEDLKDLLSCNPAK